MRYILAALVFFQIACSSAAQEISSEVQRAKAERKPFQKSSVKMKSPKEYLMRETEKGEYDPRPRVVTVDEKTGKYELRWIGYDGKEKVITYQRKDAINATVEASVSRSGSQFVYSYRIRNFADSPTYVGSFIVQTFATDVENEKIPFLDDLLIGHMSRHIPHFSDGIWRKFAPLEERNRINPGSDRVFPIVSLAKPGVVKCYARAGDSALKGVGEHMPSELEAAMPGYDELASCNTIGPIEALEKMSKEERSKYLLDNLSKFVDTGWMAGDTPKIYERILVKNDLAEALSQAKADLEQGYETSEVFHIIEGLNS